MSQGHTCVAVTQGRRCALRVAQVIVPNDKLPPWLVKWWGTAWYISRAKLACQAKSHDAFSWRHTEEDSISNLKL